MNENILDRLGTDLIKTVTERCIASTDPDTCDNVGPCQFHSGFIDGIAALVATIESELAKVGYVGP